MDSAEYGPPVPLEELARFVRSAASLPQPDFPRDPAAIDAAMRACQPRALPDGDRPQRIELTGPEGRRLSFGPDAVRGPELFRLVGELLLSAEPNPLDVPPALLARMETAERPDLEIQFAAERVVPGGGPYPTRQLRVVLSESLTGAPAIFNPGAPPGTRPLMIWSLCGYRALEELRTLLSSLTHLEGYGVILQLRDDGLTIASADDGLLTGRLTETTEVRSEIREQLGWPPSLPGTFVTPTPGGPTPAPIAGGHIAPPPLIWLSPTPVPMQAGHSVRFSGQPDPYQPRTVQLQHLSYGSSSATERARFATEDELRGRLIEFHDRLYVPEFGAPAEIAPYLAPTGERITGGGRTDYGVGAEVFRLAAPSTDDVIVLRLPGSLDERLTANRRLRRFPFVADSFTFTPEPGREFPPSRLAPGQIAPALLPGYRSSPPDGWRIEFRGRVYRPGEPTAPAAGEIELVERIRPEARPGQWNGEIAMVEVYRWRDRPLGEEILINLVYRNQLGEYEIWRRWDPPPPGPPIPSQLYPPVGPGFANPPLVPPNVVPPDLPPDETEPEALPEPTPAPDEPPE